MYKYDIKRDEWEDTNRSMRERREYHSCLLLNKEIFVAGGWGRKTTEIFDLQSKTWRSGPDLPKEIYISQLVKAQPSLKYSAFLIGGYGHVGHGEYGGQPNAISDIFALTKNYESFIKIGNLKTKRVGHVAMVHSDQLVEKCVER